MGGIAKFRSRILPDRLRRHVDFVIADKVQLGSARNSQLIALSPLPPHRISFCRSRVSAPHISRVVTLKLSGERSGTLRFRFARERIATFCFRECTLVLALVLSARLSARSLRGQTKHLRRRAICWKCRRKRARHVKLAEWNSSTRETLACESRLTN